MLGPATAGRASIPLGVVFSTTGSYRTVAREMLHGALLAVGEIDADAGLEFAFVPLVRNPGGDPAAYDAACQDLLRREGVRHVVGCYTSASRKEVIPVIEKFDALLWYPSHYEGFESSRNVVYTGAAPNQHIVPLLRYVLRERGNRAYCIGSNYIWAWENNRILREIVQGCRGAVVAEKYLPVGSTDVDRIVREIEDLRPDFVFNTLIGESSYAFYRAYGSAVSGRRDAAPVTSCSLSEPELLSIGREWAAGHIASSVYFQSIERPENRAFVERYRARFGAEKVTSADAEASYVAVHLLARAIRQAGSADVERIKEALAEIRIEAPQGPVRIDPENNHAYLTPALGVSRSDGQFDLLWRETEPVKPDPYLVWFDAVSVGERPRADRGDDMQAATPPHLRIVP